MNQPWYKWICENLDQDAGYEEPWTPNYNAWGAERALYSRQLQDANKRIHELEQELLKLREEKKAREQAIKTPSDPTVSVPLSAWNKLCAENSHEAKEEQLRVRGEFQKAFAAGLVCAGFDRTSEEPSYLLYERDQVYREAVR